MDPDFKIGPVVLWVRVHPLCASFRVAIWLFIDRTGVARARRAAPRPYSCTVASLCTHTHSVGKTFTMDQAITAAGMGPSQFKYVAVLGFFLMADSMEMLLLSFLGPSVKCGWNLSNTEVAFLTTVVFLGMMIGNWFWGFLADVQGRWYTLLYDTLFTISFSLITTFSVNYGMLCFCRCMVGFGLGGFSVAFSFFMEFIPKRSRGFWGIGLQLCWGAGAILLAGLAWAVLPRLGWRWLVGLSMIPLVGVLLGLWVLPESPRWSAIGGDLDGAQRVLKGIAEGNGRRLPAGRLVLKEEPAADVGALEVLGRIFSREWRELTGWLWVLWFANAFCYYGVVVMTTTIMYKDTDPCTKDSIWTDQDFIDIFVSTLGEIPGILIPMFVIHRIGRRPLQSTLFAAGAIFLLILIPVGTTAGAVLAFLFLARVAVTGSFAVTYVYTPEVYPTTFRTTAFGYSNGWARVGGMLCPFVAHNLVTDGYPWAAQLIMGVMCCAAALSALKLPIETRGAALRDA